jgi:polyhydroxyalkanoate synthesis repressor PhaR
MLVKRYSNRRLYDTKDSRYITLPDLAEKIREGEDVQVIDAKTGDDLTQTTLTQIIMESRGAAKLLPVPLLTQMIRLGDASLAEFLGRYMSVALALYMQAKRGADVVSTYNPFAAVPFDAVSAFARMFASSVPFVEHPPPKDIADEASRRSTDLHPDVAELRREVEELRKEIQKKRKR